MQSAMTAEKARELVEYDPETGKFYWRNRVSKMRCGSEAGYANPRGYRQISFQGKRYLAHRLAWLISYGRWPREQIDHINGNPSDNRLCNLREASQTQNNCNKRRRDNSSGFKGVSFSKRRRLWVAVITVNKKAMYLGAKTTPEEAYQLYVAAALRFQGRFSSEYSDQL